MQTDCKYDPLVFIFVLDLTFYVLRSAPVFYYGLWAEQSYVQSPNKEEIWVVDCTLLSYILQNCSKNFIDSPLEVQWIL